MEKKVGLITVHKGNLIRNLEWLRNYILKPYNGLSSPVVAKIRQFKGTDQNIYSILKIRKYLINPTIYTDCHSGGIC